MAGTDNAVWHFAEHRPAKTDNRRPLIQNVNGCNPGAASLEEIDFFDIMALKQRFAFYTCGRVTDKTASAL